LDTLETALMSDIWSFVLLRYNKRSIKLQSSKCGLNLLQIYWSHCLHLQQIRWNRGEDKQVSGTKLWLHVSLCLTAQNSWHFDESQGTVVVLQGKDKFRDQTGKHGRLRDSNRYALRWLKSVLTLPLPFYLYSNKCAQESSYVFAIGLCLFLK